MKDLDAPLSSYGLKNGSKIMMIGDNVFAFDKRPIPQPKTSVPEPVVEFTEEQKMIMALNELKTHLIDKILPKLDLLHETVGNPSKMTFKELEYLSREVGELLLRLLLKADDIQGGDLVRMERKAFVKEVQAHMDRADLLKQEVGKLKSKN